MAEARSISGIDLRRELAVKRPITFDLFAAPGKTPLGADWPAAARFPLNEDSARVADTVLTDLEQSERPHEMKEYWLERGISVLLSAFSPKSDKNESSIGLCSDSVAEGVNLQRAQAVVHLDMPSVVRIAEQRVGRIDRLDSPHDTIYAWWPEDAPEFALRSDERFIERYETVDNLLGSNVGQQ